MIDVEAIIEKLRFFGYSADESDINLIKYFLSDVIQYIYNFCHINEIPKELFKTVIDMTVYKFLKMKLATGVKINDFIDFSSCGIASITEGDVSVSYNNSDKNKLVNIFMTELDNLGNKDRELIAFRKIKW